MDYFQGVVADYLKANRCTFINPEFCFSLGPDLATAPKGTSWWVDVLAVNFAEERAYLCEVSFSKTLAAMLKRLGQWSAKWDEVQTAVRRDAHLSEGWSMTPWVFVPEAQLSIIKARMPQFPIKPPITALEDTVPWKHCTWDRKLTASGDE